LLGSPSPCVFPRADHAAGKCGGNRVRARVHAKLLQDCANVMIYGPRRAMRSPCQLRNVDKTKTSCGYEGPGAAAELNKVAVDNVTEVPVTLSPK
jgi:hypothetical protein